MNVLGYSKKSGLRLTLPSCWEICSIDYYEKPAFWLFQGYF